jgi:hypothetical protein
MNLVQVLLANWLRHEMLDAIPQSVVNDQVGANGIAGALIFD